MRKIKHLFTALLLLCSTMVATAHEFEVNGIYYNITDTTNKTVEVTYKGTSYDGYPNGYTGNVIIPESVTYKGTTYSVTSIGWCAFRECPGLKSITIPNSITRIESVAFSGCSGLTNVTIPNSIARIENSVFEGCSGLTSITIPNSVVGIHDYTFGGCTSLKEVIIEDGTEELWFGYNYTENKGLFYDCPLETLYLGRNINIINASTGDGFPSFCDNKTLSLVTVGDYVTKITDDLFKGCDNLKTVINNSSLKIEKSSMNNGCIGLYAYNIGKPESVGDFSFVVGETCTLIGYLGNDTEIVLPENYNGKDYVIGAYAFKGNTAIRSITITQGVKGIENEAFYGCSNLKTITNQSSLTFKKGTVVYGYIAYYAEEIILGLREGDYRFISIDGVNTMLAYLGNDTEIILPENYKGENYVINEDVFKGNTAITSITIPASVTNIADNAFQGCTGLKKVELNCATIGYWFSGNTSIKEIVLGKTVTDIQNYAFSGCTGLASLTVGSKVANIGTNAFNGCGNIVKVFWLGNTPPAGYEQLSGKINYVANNQYTNLTGEVVVSQFLSSKFEIDGTVYVPTSLADRTCCIVDYDILSDVSDVAIEETVSYQGVSLKVQDIKAYSFYGKENLSTVTFAHNGSIGTSAFEGCTSLAAIEIPNIVTYVDDYAFRNCTRLNDAKIKDRETVLPLGMQLFANTAIESLYIGGKISYSESDNAVSPFSESNTLKSVVITNAESNIYDYEFYNCTALESAVVGDGVEKIGRWAFSGCLNLNNFVFGSNLEEIGEEAFSDCSGLVKITGRAVLPPVCGDQALDDINKWTCKLYVPSVNLEAYKGAEQWKEFLFVEELTTDDKYVTYRIDDEIYKILLIKPGERIVVPFVEEKEDYIFNWNFGKYISPEGYPVMPDEDIEIIGSYVLTSIDEVKSESKDESEKSKSIYDLCGRKVKTLSKGIYIVNGKKTLVR